MLPFGIREIPAGLDSWGLPPVTLIHGIGGRPAHVLPIAAALGARGADVVAPALPGHDDAVPGPGAGRGPLGLTGMADTGARADLPTDVPGTAAWLLERVPTAYRLLVGHSTGGVLALAMAGPPRDPSRLDGARGADPAGVVVLDSNVPASPAAVAAKQAKARLAERPDWRAAMRAALVRDWAGPESWRERVFADLDATADEPMRSLWHSVLTSDARALWAGLRPRADGSPLPVLYVQATRDVAAEDVAPLLAPEVALTVVRAGVGHWPHLQDPAAVAGAIRAWWSGQAAR